MPYRHLTDLSISDVAFFAWAKTIEELFVDSAEAMLSYGLGNLDSLRKKKIISVKLTEKTIEMLLFAYLQEIVFYKDAKQLLLKARKPVISKKGDFFYLDGKLKGEKIDFKRHSLELDIKAVTLQNFKVEKKENWQARVVLDV